MIGKDVPDFIGSRFQERTKDASVRFVEHAENTFGSCSAKQIHEDRFDLIVLMMGKKEDVFAIFRQESVEEGISFFAEKIFRHIVRQRFGQDSDPERTSDMPGEAPEKNFVLLVFLATCPVVEMDEGQ
jgi:hypothetical protein